MDHGNFFNEPVIVAIAFAIFVIGLYKPIKKAILAMLDEQIAEAIKDIEEAKAMRKNAESMLKDAKKELEAAKKLSVEMIKTAESKSVEIFEDAKNQIKKITAKRTEISLARISQQERQLIEEFKKETIDLAVKYVQESLIKELDKSAQLALVENSITTAKKVVH